MTPESSFRVAEHRVAAVRGLGRVRGLPMPSGHRRCRREAERAEEASAARALLDDPGRCRRRLGLVRHAIPLVDSPLGMQRPAAAIRPALRSMRRRAVARHQRSRADRRPRLPAMSELPLTGGCNCAAPCGSRSTRRSSTRAGATARAASGAPARPPRRRRRIAPGSLRVAPGRGGAARARPADGGCAEGLLRRVRLGALEPEPGRPRASRRSASARSTAIPGSGRSCRQFVAYAAAWDPIPDDGLPRYPERKPGVARRGSVADDDLEQRRAGGRGGRCRRPRASAPSQRVVDPPAEHEAPGEELHDADRDRELRRRSRR